LNPRNAAAGSLKLLDARTTAARNLSFFAYATGEVSESLGPEHYENLERFRSLGLPVNEHIRQAVTLKVLLRYVLSGMRIARTWTIRSMGW